MPCYWNICHDNDQCWYYRSMLSCQKKLEGRGVAPPPSQQVGSQGEKTCLRILRLRRFCQTLCFVAWQENCSVTSKKSFLSGSVIPRLWLHTCINPVSNFDLIYQLRYILLGINDIYEDLWKEYQSEMINEAQFVNRCNETLQRPVFHGMSYNTVELFLSLMKLWKLRP